MVQNTSPERILGVGILSGIVAGLITGVCARIAMRIVALGAYRPLTFTGAGTFNILLIGTFAGFIIGALLGALCIPLLQSPRTRRYMPGPLVRDLLVSLVLFLLLALPNFFNNSPDNDFSIGPPYLGRSLFGALFLVFGVVMGGSEMLLHHYLPRKSLPAEVEKSVPEQK